MRNVHRYEVLHQVILSANCRIGYVLDSGDRGGAHGAAFLDAEPRSGIRRRDFPDDISAEQAGQVNVDPRDPSGCT